MKSRNVVVAAAVAVAILGQQNMAYAAGLLYFSNQLWVNIAGPGDTLASGAFMGRQLASFPSTAYASIDSAFAGPCNGFGAVAFAGKVTGAAPKTGIFLYDPATATIQDVAAEGAATPIGGTWASFSGVRPEVSVDTPNCIAYVFFRGKATGAPATSDTGIFAATFALPGVAPGGTTVLIREGTTAMPAPFPGAALFDEFPAGLRLAAGGGSNAAVAFRGKAIGGGVTGADNTGLFIGTPPASVTTVAREGDATCAPGWVGAGPMYAEFPENTRLGLSAATVVYAARSTGGPMATDSALEQSTGCGATVGTPAVEGSATPAGGTFADVASTTPLGVGRQGVPTLVSAPKISGAMPVTRAILEGAVGAATASGVVARHGMPDTAIGAGTVFLPTDPAPEVGGGPPNIVFGARVLGFAHPGIFYWTSPGPAPLLGFRAYNARIDVNKNVTALFR